MNLTKLKTSTQYAELLHSFPINYPSEIVFMPWWWLRGVTALYTHRLQTWNNLLLLVFNCLCYTVLSLAFPAFRAPVLSDFWSNVSYQVSNSTQYVIFENSVLKFICSAVHPHPIWMQKDRNDLFYLQLKIFQMRVCLWATTTDCDQRVFLTVCMC